MYEYVQQLYEAGLWSNLAALGGFILSFSEQENVFDARQRFRVGVMVAEALVEVKEFRRAEIIYKEALQIKKQFSKHQLTKTEASTASTAAGLAEVLVNENEENGFGEVEIKYKMHICYLNTQQPTQAFNVLQSVPAKLRTPKVNMALATIYQQAGMERSAITCYKEVLKACPLAIEAAQTLMQLGVMAKEIQGLTLEMTSAYHMDWFNTWIQGYSAIANRDYPQAISILKSLEEEYPPLRNSVNLMVSVGQCQHYQGDSHAATITLQRVHKLDPYNLRGMDVLAALLAKDKKIKELELLAKKLMSVSEDAPEPWVAMGYYCYLNKKGTRAVYFAHKACILHHRSIEALLLKGNVLLDLKKIQDAMNHFREAIQLAPQRYECHNGLVRCYLAQSRHREAINVATTACKQLNNSARVLTLYASVLVKDPTQTLVSKAKNFLEKALAADPTYLPAVYLLTELLEHEMNFDQAIALLKKQLAIQTSCKLHRMLADLLAKTHDEEKAMEHYGIALNLDPKNLPAQEGLQKIEQATDTPMDPTDDGEMEEMNSDDGDLEESEAEAVWSDGDINLTASGSVNYLDGGGGGNGNVPIGNGSNHE